MSKLMATPPSSPIEPVTEVLHGVAITDPYRWLEERESQRTRAWLAEQGEYTRSYFDTIVGRERIHQRIHELLDIETYDSLQKVAGHYFFRKRLPGEEQPCIYMRDGAEGNDQLLLNPMERGTGKYTAIKPIRISSDGHLMLYEVKEGGERTSTFELLDIENRRRLPDTLSRGYLRGFAFAPDGRSFYYSHEALDAKRPLYRAAHQHLLGSPFAEDMEIFYGGEGDRLRLCLTSDEQRLGFLVYRFLEKTHTDFYLKAFASEGCPEAIINQANYSFGPRLIPGRMLAITDRDAPNLRIVEIRFSQNSEPVWIDVVPESDDRIVDWLVVGDHVFVSRIRGTSTRVSIFDVAGNMTGEVPVCDGETIRLIGGSCTSDELLIEAESLTEPIGIFRYTEISGKRTLWAKRSIPFKSTNYVQRQVWYRSKDGTRIPMLLMGRADVLDSGVRPTIMTSYGGHGVSMTPQFSVFVAFLVERGCLFALPNIRGGSEFGTEWHIAAKRHMRQTAYDDFLCAAEWLIKSGRSTSERLAIFGGSNSGLLVGAALTQRPDIFRAALCMVPMLDMLRYHLFDNAHVWRDEYGTADDPDDFTVLASYSPYHQVRKGISYPATLIVSGDADSNCNPLHARKMTARLQTANASSHPILLDYNKHRGHSPVLPLSERTASLADRLAFLCDQLQLTE